MESRARAAAGRGQTVVVGVAGGIGSGKSALARAFGGLGFAVVDADAEARAALDRGEVRARLVSWWGSGILDDAGRVDRRAVARIVFGDASERARLEGLVHPIAIARCEEEVAAARRAGGAGVVIDAPLLYEAGLDEKCDAVVFVDAAEDLRRGRVEGARGWGPGEMARREGVQMDLAEKRGQSRFVVENNSSDLSVLEAEASRIYDILRLEAGSQPES